MISCAYRTAPQEITSDTQGQSRETNLKVEGLEAQVNEGVMQPKEPMQEGQREAPPLQGS